MKQSTIKILLIFSTIAFSGTIAEKIKADQEDGVLSVEEFVKEYGGEVPVLKPDGSFVPLKMLLGGVISVSAIAGTGIVMYNTFKAMKLGYVFSKAVLFISKLYWLASAHPVLLFIVAVIIVGGVAYPVYKIFESIHYADLTKCLAKQQAELMALSSCNSSVFCKIGTMLTSEAKKEKQLATIMEMCDSEHLLETVRTLV